jgi:hypothetical protein
LEDLRGKEQLNKYWSSDNLTGRDHLEDLDVVGRIILKCILKKCVVKFWNGSI